MSSIGEIKAVLADVAEHTRAAVEQARRAADAIDAAVRTLVEAGRQHHESLVPAALSRAGDELARGCEQLVAAGQAVADLDARL